VASELADVRSSSGGGEIEQVRRAVDRLKGDVVTLKSKMKQQKARATARQAELREELRAVRRDAGSSDRCDDRAHRTAEQRIAALTAELAEVRDDLAEANQARTELRSQLRSQRRELAAARKALEAGGSASASRDPVALARELDLAAASVPRRQPRERAADDDTAFPAPARMPLEIPRGIRPDRAEAVEWLLGAGAVAVIVDGYNLLFKLEPGDLPSGRSRRRLEALMAQFARKSGGNATVRIVFDSSLPGTRDQRSRDDGVVVVFAEADRLADEEVVHLAAETAGPVVVVTSDREVRENAALVGAAALWSEAFVEWFAEA
jgi:predicted RNA-binding protein with PIN domain